MKKNTEKYIDIEIDKLTNSIENTISGDVFDTDVFLLSSKDTKQIKKSDWVFNWKQQILLKDRETYKLVIKDNPGSFRD